MTHSQECIARAVQDGLGALADSLQESGEARGDTVRLAAQDLMRFIEEFRRLQELEMLAADVVQWMESSGSKNAVSVSELIALYRFFGIKPAAGSASGSKDNSMR